MKFVLKDDGVTVKGRQTYLTRQGTYRIDVDHFERGWAVRLWPDRRSEVRVHPALLPHFQPKFFANSPYLGQFVLRDIFNELSQVSHRATSYVVASIIERVAKAYGESVEMKEITSWPEYMEFGPDSYKLPSIFKQHDWICLVTDAMAAGRMRKFGSKLRKVRVK